MALKKMLSVSRTIHADGSVIDYGKKGMPMPEPPSLSHIGKEAMITVAQKKYAEELNSNKKTV